MAQKTIVQLVDDLDGTTTSDIETVSFALDGASYEIELSPGNARKLRDHMAEFVTEARRTGGRKKRGTATATATATATKPAATAKPTPAPAPSNREQTKAIREWARSQGHNLSSRGRIPAHIIEEFEQAHEPKQSSKKSTRGGGSKKKAASPTFSG